MWLFDPVIRVCQIIIILVFSLTNISESAHIVFLHTLASYSHRVASAPLAEKLLSRGHNVTYIAPDPPKIPNPNITEVIPIRVHEFMYKTLRTDHGVMARMYGLSLPYWWVVDVINVNICQELLESDELKSWLATSPQVDLIYADSFPECAYGLAYKLQGKVKVALFVPIPLLPRHFDQLGIPDESSSIPIMDYRSVEPLSLLERTRNALTILAWHFGSVISTIWLEQIMREALEIPNFPSVEEMHKNLSLVLMNGHFIDEHPRSLPPFFVSVPGLHVKETHQPLPEHLEGIINSTDSNGNPSEGFVYISLGTVVNPETIPQYILDAFYNAIKAFPNIQFLWKWNAEFPEDVPKNLHFSKWFEQQDVLGHPKILAFIFQAGRPSTQEALCNAVPMITFPVLGDQDYNANRLQNLGVSINLEIGKTTTAKLKNALSSVIYDGSFKKKAVQLAKLFKDLPMSPVDTAAWWTEYILRHEDTNHLKPVGRHQTWYQRRLLDVWLLVIFVLISALYIMLRILRFVLIRGEVDRSSEKLKAL